jgi:hypothetical protein
MTSFRSGRRLASVTLVAAVAIAGMGPSRASVISGTPTLPLLGVPYVSSGAGCFPAAGFCIENASLILTSPVVSSFNALGQDIMSGADYFGTLTNSAHAPIGTVHLTGSVEQEILGRTFATETGTWATELISLSLSGLVQGNTLTVSLDPTNPSTGETSITPVGDQSRSFKIDSFFDIFIEISLDTPTPLHTIRGPIRAQAVSVPEPSSIAAIALPLLAIAAIWRRRSRSNVLVAEDRS